MSLFTSKRVNLGIGSVKQTKKNIFRRWIDATTTPSRSIIISQPTLITIPDHIANRLIHLPLPAPAAAPARTLPRKHHVPAPLILIPSTVHAIADNRSASTLDTPSPPLSTNNSSTLISYTNPEHSERLDVASDKLAPSINSATLSSSSPSPHSITRSQRQSRKPVPRYDPEENVDEPLRTTDSTVSRSIDDYCPAYAGSNRNSNSRSLEMYEEVLREGNLMTLAPRSGTSGEYDDEYEYEGGGVRRETDRSSTYSTTSSLYSNESSSGNQFAFDNRSSYSHFPVPPHSATSAASSIQPFPTIRTKTSRIRSTNFSVPPSPSGELLRIATPPPTRLRFHHLSTLDLPNSTSAAQNLDCTDSDSDSPIDSRPTALIPSDNESTLTINEHLADDGRSYKVGDPTLNGTSDELEFDVLAIYSRL